MYVNLITELFTFDPTDIFEKTKRRSVVDARQLLYYLCNERKIGVSTIEELLAESGFETPRQSITHGINVFKERMSDDKDYQTIVKKLKNAARLK